MKPRLLFYVKYAVFWISIFLFFRVVFILYHLRKFHGVLPGEIIGTFTHGFKMDLSLTGYILLLPTLLLILFSLFSSRILITLINLYTIVVFSLLSLLFLVDLELYRYWGFRLDITFLEYINTPKAMLASTNMIYYFLLVVILTLLTYFIYRFYYKKWVLNDLPSYGENSWKSSIIFLFLMAFLFIPIRGGINTASLNTGSVYFCEKLIVNHACINPVWNFLYALTERNKLNYSVNFFDRKREDDLLVNLESQEKSRLKVLSCEKPNIILIILESFGQHVIKELGGKKGVTNNFSKLIPEGIFFDNIYASGPASNKGIGAILSGYPALPNSCIMLYENKTQHLPAISKSLKELNYTSRFFYGGDINFSHFKSYLINCGFDQIISQNDFPKSERTASWGVPDHLIFKRLLEESAQADQPFFHAVFTLSSHEPFDVPMETVIEGNTREAKYLNSVYYTDQSLGDFIDKLKQQEWWKNTLVILVADHGACTGARTHYDKNRFHIPLLFTGGALIVKDTTIRTYGSQTDISVTLLDQLQLSTSEYYFSKDLLSSESKSYAFYSFQNGFGFVDDTLNLTYDLTNNHIIGQKEIINDYEPDHGKAYLQWLLRDFANR